ncbi:MAG: hypothetical protein CVV13_03165 [Gammaproteobacteria bacterium HGW-Gammaproteobacteria-3]|nr:MAG: hypothetical protein CVV13_03165 [Gammaproteobacteria bacterium HGW-Gammaproteobacteria-3]
MNTLLSFQVHGGGDHGEGAAHYVTELLTFIDGLLTREPGDIFAAFMPGVSAMENIHPLLVHFPIAFLLGFFLLDVLGTLTGKLNWRAAAGVMLYLGTLAAGLTVWAGLAAADKVAHDDIVHAIMERHEHFGIAVLSLSVVLSIWRLLVGTAMKGAINGFYLLLSFTLCILVSKGADLGGLMVYNYGVAVTRPSATVNTNPDMPHNHDTLPHSHGQPQPGHDHSQHSH